MPRRLPSLNALRMFEAAARLGSFKRASEELHVTQSAVSRQVSLLEEQLGAALFERRNRAITMTEAARLLHPVLTRALDDIDDATGRIREREAEPPRSARLVITSTPGIAELWLGRRLGAFCRDHSWVDPEILIAADPGLLDEGRADLAIHYGSGELPGLRSTPLHATVEFPVCSPELLLEKPLDAPEDLGQHRLLHWQSRGRWGAFLRRGGISGVHWDQGPVLHDYALALDMAIAGEGVALADDLLAAEHLFAGRLVKPLALSSSSERQQVLLERAGEPRPWAASAFRDWLLEEIARHCASTAILRQPLPFAALPEAGGPSTRNLSPPD
ncbi:MAG: LysR substrate-binding domain-containing protein [Pseudomonadales bacterium]|nr:LysR substrate-binding domain-containing protein [Pseudomonadales bacterium]